MTSRTHEEDPHDELTSALHDAADVLEGEAENAKAIIRWARTVIEERGKGMGYGAIVQPENPPVGVLLAASARALREAATSLRRAEARTLHQEGMTMLAIAEVFGVSRQRVAKLLRPSPDGDPS
jgi:hypothetical protein